MYQSYDPTNYENEQMMERFASRKGSEQISNLYKDSKKVPIGWIHPNDLFISSVRMGSIKLQVEFIHAKMIRGAVRNLFSLKVS